jgi:hypothetical protein
MRFRKLPDDSFRLQPRLEFALTLIRPLLLNEQGDAQGGDHDQQQKRRKPESIHDITVPAALDSLAIRG